MYHKNTHINYAFKTYKLNRGTFLQFSFSQGFHFLFMKISLVDKIIVHQSILTILFLNFKPIKTFEHLCDKY